MPLTEDDLLQGIRKMFGGFQGKPLPAYHDAVLRLGVEALDDAAIIEIGETILALSTDFVRGEGFNLYRKGKLNRYDTGYYLAVATLSDVAAMGIAPAAMLTVVRYADPTASEVLSTLRGIRDACIAHGVVVIGGDSGTYASPVLAATAIGFGRKGRFLTRSGARPGHKIFISCAPGFAGTALFYFMQKDVLRLKLTRKEEAQLALAWRRPMAEVRLGPRLTRVKGIGACQDISDGLQRTLDQVARGSGVRVVIEESRLPIHSLTRKVAEMAQISPTVLALSDSVDFGLVATAPNLPRTLLSNGRRPVGFTKIGYVDEGAGSTMIDDIGDEIPLSGVPWAQQVDDITQLIKQAGKRSTR